MKKLEDSTQVSSSDKARCNICTLSDDEEATLGPLIKTETTDSGQGQQNATQTELYTAAEIPEFQQKI